MNRCPHHGTFHVHRTMIGTYAVIGPDDELTAATDDWPTAVRVAHLLNVHGLIAVDLDELPPINSPWPPPTGRRVDQPPASAEAMRRHPSTYTGGDQ